MSSDGGCPPITPSPDGSIYYTASTLPPAVRALNLTYPDVCAISPRQLAESFVTGHSGVDSHAELAVLLLTVGMWVAVHRVAMILLRAVFFSKKTPAVSSARSFLTFGRLSSFVFEWCCLIAPVVVGMTLAADYVYAAFLGQLLIISLLVVAHRSVAGYWCVHFFRSSGDAAAASTSALILQRMNQMPKAFISNYRTSLMIGTSVAILAVGP
jgi:hypothetical protein